MTLPRWFPVALDFDEWDLVFPAPQVVYICKAPGCVVTCGTLEDTKGHERETGHSQFFLREIRKHSVTEVTG